MFVLETDRLTAVFAQLGSHKVESATLVAERFSGSKRIDFDGRSAGLAVCAQIIKAFETSALALPITNLVFDKIESGRAAKIRDGED